MTFGHQRCLAGRPFLVIGGLGIIAGGFVSAATAPNATEHGSWAAAYLVLVVGVAQIALGIGQAVLAAHPPSLETVTLQVVLWNTANAAVIAGTLARITWLVYVGGVLLISALAAFGYGTRSSGTSPTPNELRGSRLPLFAFRVLIALLLISIPIGLVLATIRDPR